MEVRLRPKLGGHGMRLGIFVLNDTESSALTIFDTDLTQLGNIDVYYGWYRDIYVVIANGPLERLQSLWVETRFVESTALVPW